MVLKKQDKEKASTQRLVIKVVDSEALNHLRHTAKNTVVKGGANEG
jgi:hypothetical protein